MVTWTFLVQVVLAAGHRDTQQLRSAPEVLSATPGSPRKAASWRSGHLISGYRRSLKRLFRSRPAVDEADFEDLYPPANRSFNAGLEDLLRASEARGLRDFLESRQLDLKRGNPRRHPPRDHFPTAS